MGVTAGVRVWNRLYGVFPYDPFRNSGTTRWPRNISLFPYEYSYLHPFLVLDVSCIGGCVHADWYTMVCPLPAPPSPAPRIRQRVSIRELSAQFNAEGSLLCLTPPLLPPLPPSLPPPHALSGHTSDALPYRACPLSSPSPRLASGTWGFPFLRFERNSKPTARAYPPTNTPM